MQKFNVSLSIDVPEDLIVISKVELEKLEQEKLSGVYWNMKDLSKRVNKSPEWIKENILYPTRFKEQLDYQKGGCVFYPQSQGQTWAFHAKRMAKFLDDNFSLIFKK